EHCLPNGRTIVISDTKHGEIADHISNKQHGIELACVNSNNQSILAGYNSEIMMLFRSLKEIGSNVSLMNYEFAVHCKLQVQVANVLKSQLNNVEFSEGKIPFANNLDGKLLLSVDANYFCEQIMKTIRFDECIRTLNTNSVNHYIEVGAHPILLYFVDNVL